MIIHRLHAAWQCLLLSACLALFGPIAHAAPGQTNTTQSVPEDDFTVVEEENVIEISDPFEGVNRVMFKFNDKVYFIVLKPVARAWRNVPEPGRVSVKNFFTNLLAPVRIVNSGLQLKGEDATNETVRFLVNTTIGVLGLFDVAKSDFGIPIKKEDFGQTLGHYEIGHGPYLVLPFLGPSSARDGVGLLVDGAYLDPVGHVDEAGEYAAIRAIDITNEISLDKDSYEALKRDALDPYIFLRNAYIQHRNGMTAK